MLYLFPNGYTECFFWGGNSIEESTVLFLGIPKSLLGTPIFLGFVDSTVRLGRQQKKYKNLQKSFSTSYFFVKMIRTYQVFFRPVNRSLGPVTRIEKNEKDRLDKMKISNHKQKFEIDDHDFNLMKF